MKTKGCACSQELTLLYGSHLAPWRLRNYVKEHLRIGDTFMAPDDIYNNDRVNHLSERRVVDYYRNMVLTKDWCGRPETFQYFDVFTYLRRGGR